MRLNEDQDIRRVRMLALGTGLVAAVLGTLLLAFLPSSPSAAPAAPPTNTGEPRVTGTPRVGEVQRTTRGTWSGTAPISYSFRWFRCNGRGAPDASDCTRISNAPNATYVARAADAGFRLRSQVRASNAEGAATATSNATEVIQSDRPDERDRADDLGHAERGLATDREPRHVGRRAADHVLVPVAPL